MRSQDDQHPMSDRPGVRPVRPLGAASRRSRSDQARSTLRQDRTIALADRCSWPHTARMSPDVVAQANDVVARLALQLVMSTDDDLDDTIVDVLRSLGHLEDADRAYITMYEDDGSFRNSHEWCRPGVESHQETIHDLRASDFPWSVGLAERGEVLTAATLEDMPDEGLAEKTSFGRFGVKSVLQVPMRVHGRLRCLIGFNHLREARRWSDETVAIVSAIADAIAVVLARRDTDRAIRQARDEAQRASRAKDEFIARMSHELRTPLHAILGFAELLRLETSSDTAAASIDQIESSGRRLLTFVEDLLDIGRVASGEHKVAVGPLPLRFAVERALVEQRSIAATRGVKVVLSGSLNGVVVRADDHMLRKVLNNLVSNAIKYGSSGGLIEIDAFVADGACRLTVRDHGDGIAPDQIERAFGSFVRLGEDQTGEPGMGVGLTMSRSYMEQMGGALELESTLGEGTTAVVTLPMSLDV
jgi:signal transduction histidine kinase